MPVTVADVKGEFANFGISFTETQLQQVAAYVDLLERWGHAINLTSIRDTGEVLRRHFAESIYLTRFVELTGRLIDVGSGAGFPGLPLKIAVPDLKVVLLEPVAKKRAFLKEVVRQCELQNVAVSGARVEEYRELGSEEFEYATVRAVGHFGAILPALARCLHQGGSVYMWLTQTEISSAGLQNRAVKDLFQWSAPIPVPFSRDRVILPGNLAQGPSSHPEISRP